MWRPPPGKVALFGEIAKAMSGEPQWYLNEARRRAALTSTPLIWRRLLPTWRCQFRAVGPEELADIVASGAYRLGAGQEVKYFRAHD